MNVYRTAERLTVAAPMPGLGPEDITVEVTADGDLVLNGKLRAALEGDKEVLMDEWSVGRYHRNLALPVPVDGEGAAMTSGNGVLVVALPVAEAVRPALLVTLEPADRRAATGGPAPTEIRLDTAGDPALITR